MSSHSVRLATARRQLRLLAESGARVAPLVVVDRAALPAGFPVGRGKGVGFARGPAVHQREAEVHVVDVGGDRRLAEHGSGGGLTGVDLVELIEQARVARVEQVRLAARRAVEDFWRSSVAPLENGIGWVHGSSFAVSRDVDGWAAACSSRTCFQVTISTPVCLTAAMNSGSVKTRRSVSRSLLLDVIACSSASS